MVEAGTLCGNTDVEKYSGLNANSTADAEAYTNVYILEAEGVIVALARFDFVGSYSDLTSIAKEFLREAAAVYAALGVIMYDMNSYTSRIEAEDMVNVLITKWETAKAIILNQDWVDFSKT